MPFFTRWKPMLYYFFKCTFIKKKDVVWLMEILPRPLLPERTSLFNDFPYFTFTGV